MNRIANGMTLATCLVLCGCSADVVDDHAEHLGALVDMSLPSPDTTIAEVLKNSELDETLLIAGRIYGGEFPAFDPATARFTIVELPEPGHSHEDPGDCVFCKRKLENAEIAAVNLVDDKGQIIATPADKLLGLKEGATVVVSGRPARVGDMLVIDASRIRELDDAAAAKLSEAIWNKQKGT